jgi:hypothetical protein
MDKPRLAALVAVGVIVVLLGGRALRGCMTTEEDRVRAQIRAVADAVEAHEVSDAVAPVSETYRDAEGLTKPLVRGYLVQQALAHRKIAVRIEGEVAVTIRKDGLATAVFYARFAEGGLDALAGGGESWRFEADLRKEEGVWKIVTSRRERAG